jgi:ABC-type Fe3+/spermidine/putrescine transport system ATPase subunit
MIRRIASWPVRVTLVVVLVVVPGVALAADPIVVSVWGGNWKDTVDKVVAKPFTAKTGIPVEFEVGGTLDRLAKARVSKAAPLVDITFTTTHVGRLYIFVRPERVELGATGSNALSARVVGVMYLGDHSEVRLALAGGQRLLAIARGGVSLAAGDAVMVGFAPDAFLDLS